MYTHNTLPLFMWVLALSFWVAAPLVAQTNNPTINIQGTLRDAAGRSVEDGVYQVTFKLYRSSSGGTPIWQETGAVNAKGGAYSFNLGGSTPLTSDVFGSTVYLGIVFNGFELMPRAEFNYAPYAFGSTIAQTVACSGALGDIKYSILDPVQFASVNGDCWVPMNGAALPTSNALRMLTGRTALPDGSGLFIQGQEFSGGRDRDAARTPASPIATLQTDEFKGHTHTVTTAGEHTHPFYEFIGCCGGSSAAEAVFEVGVAANFSIYALGNRIELAGAHSHNVNNTGGSETRSKNLNLWIYIRIQ